MIKQKIDRNSVQEILELNPTQKGMLYHYLGNLHANLFNVQLAFELAGNVNIIALKEAIELTQAQNESLRSVFRWEEVSKPIQIILKSCPVDFVSKDLSHHPAEEISGYIDAEIQKDQQKRFDLSKVPLRFTVLKASEKSSVLVITFHHILFDGWSNGILLKEMFSYYKSLNNQQEPELRHKPRFKEVQTSLSNYTAKNISPEFWYEYLNLYEIVPLFTENPTSAQRIVNIRKHQQAIPIAALEAFSKKHKLTKAAVVYAAYGILLQKYGNTEDVVFGTTVANRDALIPGIHATIGNFINTLPLRISTQKGESLLELVSKVNSGLIKRHTHNHTPYSSIKNFLELKPAENLFDTVVVFENYPIDKELSKVDEDLEIRLRAYYESTDAPLMLSVFADNELRIEYSYNTTAVKESFIQKFSQHLFRIITQIISAPDQLVSTLSILGQEEMEQLLYNFNKTKVETLEHNTLVDIFQEQVRKTPDRIALVYKDRKLTFTELNEKSNQLARKILQTGVKREEIIGIMLPRKEEMIISMLAVLKSGCAYLPLDPGFPLDRINYMIEDSELSILLTESSNISLNADLPASIVVLDVLSEDSYDLDTKNIELPISAKSLAYLIYTSGSTGKPKGIMIEHASVLNYVEAVCDRIQETQYKSILCLTTMSFDIFVTETFLPLLKGLKIVLADANDQKNPVKLGQLVIENAVDLMQITPSHLGLFLHGTSHEFLEPLKAIMVGGEAFPLELLEELRRDFDGKIYNMYGPTETTVWSAIQDLTNKSQVDIGSPIRNTSIYVLDNNHQLQPIGVPGELCIGGEGLARGYWKREALTKEKFIGNPYQETERIYKTGDLAIRKENGDISILGRLDSQVKIRGFRIELGEIESQINSYDPVKEAAVIISEKGQDKFITAYYTSEKNLPELKDYVKNKLPEYMVPAYFLRLEHLPLTPNGKLDRKSLPVPEIQVEANFIVPTNETEQKLVEIWSDVLGHEKISTHMNFFDIGGDSLKVMTLIGRIYKGLDIEISIEEIFEYPSIRLLSDHIGSAKKQQNESYAPLLVAPPKEYYDLSPAQQRLFFLYEFDKSSLVYNLPNIIVWEGDLDRHRLDFSLKKLLARHDSLRTSFEVIDNIVKQKISDNIALSWEHFQAKEEDIDQVVKNFIRPFDLGQAPLIRAGLLEINAQKHLLMVDMHHIISDGVSGKVLLDEFLAIYKEESLPPLNFQYKDYSEWQQQEAQQGLLARQKEFWLKEFEEEVPVLDLVADYTRPALLSFEGDSLEFKLNQEETQKLKSIGEQEGTTLFMTLLSAYYILLSKLSNQEDVIIGTPVANRQHPEFEQMVGVFINTLALRNSPIGSLSFQGFLSQVKSKTLACFNHLSFPFADLIEELDLERDVSRNALFDCMFIFQNMGHPTWDIPGVEVSPYTYQNHVSKFDITLEAWESRGEIHLRFEYATRLFRKETIQRFVSYYKNIISAILTDLDTQISEIELLSQGEKHQLLEEFNQTYNPYPKSRSIVELFEEQVERSPESLAIVTRESSLTFQELNAKANQIGHLLQNRGVEKEEVIGIMLPRCPEMLISLLGVLKAGCAYLPLDPSYPISRIEYMVENSDVKILLTEPNLQPTYEQLGQDLVAIDVISPEAYKASKENLSKPFDAHNLAYLIYTSGSTGTPKGIMIEHQSVVNYVNGVSQRVDASQYNTILCLTTMSFDIFVTETILPLLKGLKIVLANSADQKDPDALNKLIENFGVDILQITPSHLNLVLNSGNHTFLTCLKAILVGGEALPYPLFKELSAKYAGKIFNMYGPTETTVWSTVQELTNKSSIDIGKPINNTSIYILDKHNKPQPIGVPGELCIGGDGLARGYWKNERLTAEKFADNPFIPGEKMYRTGDLAKWNPTGDIHFIGRIDNQVKIAGFRLELGEIEYQLTTFEHIEEIVVLAREQKLIAYYTSTEEFSVAALRDHLSDRLPAYMIPAYYVHLISFPLTSNGKINRKALPDPQIKTETDYIAPKNEREQLLVNTWSEVLGIEKIGTEDNFFLLGGDSIKSIQISSRIRNLGYELSVKDLFSAQTISKLSNKLRQLAPTNTQVCENSKAKRRTSFLELINPKEKAQYEIEDVYPLSPMQEGMFYHAMLDPTSEQYFQQTLIPLSGNLNIKAVEASMNDLIARYEILRTVFVHEGYERPLQLVLSERKIEVQFHDIQEACLNGSKHELIKSYCEEDKARKFDLSQDVLMRLTILQTGKNEYEWIWSYHHILMDGWCLGIIFHDFKELYKKHLGLGEIALANIKSYSEYIHWLEDRDKEETQVYWNQYLAGYENLASFPKKAATSLPLSSSSIKRETLVLNQQKREEISQISQKHGVSLNTILQSAWAILLSKYNGVNDVVFGTVVSGRPREIAEIETMVGLFINTIPMRIQVGAKLTFAEIIQRTQASAFSHEDHAYHPLSEIQAQSYLGRELLNHILIFENFPANLETTNSEHTKTFELGEVKTFEQTNYDLAIQILPGEEIKILFQYNPAVYDSEIIKRAKGHLARILEQIIENDQIKPAQIKLLEGEEKAQILQFSHPGMVDFPEEKTVLDLFEEQVKKSPHKIAVHSEGSSISYQELDQKANKLGHFLKKRGVEAESLIGLCMEKSIDLMIGMLGILKAGAAYVPLDPSYPSSRIKYLLEDSELNVILGHSHSREVLAPCLEGRVFISLDIEWANISEEESDPPSREVTPNNLIYIIYTSGSTGQPKGVLIEHKSVSNLISGLSKEYNFDEDDAVLQVSSVSFDASVEQIFLALTNGASLILVSSSTLLDKQKLGRIIEEQKISHIHATPSYLKTLTENLDPTRLNSLKRLIAGGEPCPSAFADAWKNQVSFYNEYGPTETTVTNTIFPYTPEEQISQNILPIGKPVQNNSIYILDPFLNPVPIGILGEIYIGGEGLARGYLRREALTKERFIDNPFEKESESRLYKSGDKARWTDDGSIEILGRIDEQVKIRGFRIEPGEIENHLSKYTEVKESVVISKGENEEKYLIAYYTSEQELAASDLKEHLLQQLPEYMVPGFYVHLESLPLTSHGKVDKKGLPDIEIKLAKDFVAPSTEVERKLAKIWSDILNIDQKKLSINTNFFEIGGHSLRVLTMIGRIHKVFQIKISIQDFFEHLNIKSLGAFILSQKGQVINHTYSPVPQAENQAYYKLSSGQKRLFFLHEFDPSSLVYNISNSFLLEGEVDKERLNNAFVSLINRHESLHTSIEVVDNQAVQKINKEFHFEIEYLQANEGTLGAVIKEFIRPFELNKGPLIRTGLVEITAQKHLLIVDIHHIISDGVSGVRLISDLMALYNEEELSPVKLQYKDYAAWQHSQEQLKQIANQKEFWLNEFAEEINIPNLPVDYPRPPVLSFEGESVEFELSEEECQKLKAIGEENGATLFMVLLSAFNILLSKLTQQEDIIIGIPVANRQHPDLEEVIGVFVNTLAFRNFPQGTLSYKNFLQEVKSKTLSYFENQAYPYENLINELNIERDTSRNALFDCMFVFQNTEATELSIPGLNIKPYEYNQHVSKFDMTFEVLSFEKELGFRFEYATAIFKEESIQRFIQYFRKIISAIITDANIPISEIDILSGKERAQLLDRFNDTHESYPKEKTVLDLFEEQVKLYPDHTAVVYEEREINYRDLNKRANQLGTYLQEQGVGPDSLVGICVERSLEMMIGILGILKAGAAYVPIDPAYPLARISYIIGDTGMEVFLTNSQSVPEFSIIRPDQTRIILLDKEQEEISKLSDENPIKRANPENIMYAIYTSGSTGMPKGVLVAHTSVVNLLHGQTRYFGFTSDERVLQFFSMSFDASVEQIFLPLVNGAALVLVSKSDLLDHDKIRKLLRNQRITDFRTTPSYLGNLKNLDSSHLRRVTTGGEACPIELADAWRKRVNFYNLYGPTEATVIAAQFYYAARETKVHRKLPIGRPLANTQIYLLDAYHKLVPLGVPGELYIGGDCLSRGYLNRPKLSDEKFVKNPFISGQKMYKTGDLAIWNPDGTLDFLGRVDEQVKVRGFRIELGEIENELNTHPKILESLLIVKKIKGNKELIAYYASDHKLQNSEIRSHLAKKLPDYMVPSYYIHMTQFPLTINGKIDKKSLPEYIQEKAENLAKPINQVQKELLSIWANVLEEEEENIGVNMNFFEIGGNSLKLINLTSIINQQFDVKINVATLFKYPMISLLAEFLGKEEKNTVEVEEDAFEQLSLTLQIIESDNK